MKFKVKCRNCKKDYDIPATLAQIGAWQSGAMIQDAMPNLTPDQRELLITQTCGDCFEDLFKGMD